ncbi:polynucleotide adenylyltransferase PcnB [Alteromonas oceanisediminis]|uniref:polynucleotide adenylyltransferase PcnB n=1 Tax=Alteromonas oceanisediminis TaxID=2836180 RepID=UPI001BD99385|nr:polynucleotide adenylyltransferase PcnB [Alteromonas oceanisediminis]MBT0587683.1 polynucleotide adenylyltransferase PcnB [Alteromonas oceanisediminis]
MPRAEHPVSRTDISDNALKVLHRLNDAGFDAYLVGGCVRDIMLGQQPKDFDVVTNATPEEIKAQFRNCRLIGRRFRLAHILFGREIIEVATFRGHHGADEKPTELGRSSDEGQLTRDNVFGSINEDAERRDFTFNAMYYSAADFSVSDFANGVQAIKRREVELIGDPETRYREDPVRMLRAVRFAAKLNMKITPRTGDPIHTLSGLLSNIPAARLFEEYLKLFLSGNALKTFELMQHYGLLTPLFPQLKDSLSKPDSREYQLIEQVLINTDNRINNEQRVTPAFLLAAFLWYPLEEHSQRLITESGLQPHDAFLLAMSDVLGKQTQRIMIPKRFSTAMREIWQLQWRLPKRYGRRASQLLEHPRFRAAYDFLLLRGEIEGGDTLEVAQWWTAYQDASPDARRKMANSGGKGGASRRRPRRPRKAKKPDA